MGPFPCAWEPWGKSRAAWTARGWPSVRRGVLVVELRRLGAGRQRRGAGLAAAGRGGDGVEVADAHLALVAHRGEALGLRREFCLLQLAVRAHAAVLVAARQLE